jgi:hypothetical protein
MLMTLNMPTFLAAATPVAPALPSPHNVDETRRLGYVLALAGRRAR